MSDVEQAMSDITARLKKITEIKTEWVETHIAGLLAAGIKKDEIEIQEHKNLETRIVVRGGRKFTFKVVISSEETDV